jgi:hypothetical protein
MRRAFNGNYPITQAFGVYDQVAYANYPGSKHPGTDYGLPVNTELVAGMSGIVTVYDRSATEKVGRGKEVQINFANLGRRNCHMNRIDVVNGQFVHEGQQIGLSGNTGFSTGPHLHDELLVNGEYTDLEKYLKEVNMDEGTVHNLYLSGWQRKASSEELKMWVGRPMQDFFYEGGKNQYEWLWRQITDLKKTNCTPEERQLLDLLKKVRS